MLGLLITMSSGFNSVAEFVFYGDPLVNAVIVNPAQVHGGTTKIMELMSIVFGHLGKFGGEIPPDGDGRKLIMNIAEVWFLGKDLQEWGPYFPGVIKDASRTPHDNDREPLHDMEILGQTSSNCFEWS